MKLGLLSAAFAGALTLSASAAFANTVVFDPLSPGNDVISEAGFDNYLTVDLNQDGYGDVRFGIQSSSFGGAFIRAVSDQFRFVNGAPNTPDDPGLGDGPSEIDSPFGGFIADYQEVTLADRLFAAGDTVGAGDFTGNSNDYLYGRTTASAENLLPNVGDSAFFGIRIEIGQSEYQPLDGFLPTGFLGETETFFGFIEVSHGSIVIGQAGYNTSASQPAIIPGGTPSPVPLPAGALLLIGALGGLGVTRLRRRA